MYQMDITVAVSKLLDDIGATGKARAQLEQKFTASLVELEKAGGEYKTRSQRASEVIERINAEFRTVDNFRDLPLGVVDELVEMVWGEHVKFNLDEDCDPDEVDLNWSLSGSYIEAIDENEYVEDLDLYFTSLLREAAQINPDKVADMLFIEVHAEPDAIKVAGPTNEGILTKLEEAIEHLKAEGAPSFITDLVESVVSNGNFQVIESPRATILVG
jgi:hypothetical protein